MGGTTSGVHTLRIVHTRGAEQQKLAEALTDDPLRVKGDLDDQCVDLRADILITKRLSQSFDLVPQLIPHELDFDSAKRVVAAVGGGPHSELAAQTADLLGSRLGLPALFVCAFRASDGPAEATAIVERLMESVPGVDHRIVEAERAADLIETDADEAILLLGAPGGSFFQRRYFGPGARLIARAPVGAIAVQSAPRRVFQWPLAEAEWVGRHLPAPEALRLSPAEVMVVVDDGKVIGLARRADLATVGTAAVEKAMFPPVTLDLKLEIDEALELRNRVGGPLPVVDGAGRFLGLCDPTA